jgi:predicted KAP-like P-loop ATPase
MNYDRPSLRPEAKDVVELKEKVSESIAEQQRRILIVIDDIDRLNPEEIRLLFRVVKAVADFPNVTYLLAFDQEAVSKALTGETQIISGQSYLEKIIQVPFELPLPDEVALRNLLFEKLDAILQDTPEDLFDSDHWSDVYWEGIDHFIKTPVTSSA